MYQKVFRLHEQLYKALANQKRIEIIHLLRDKELSVSQIKTMLGLPQANLSQNLAVLREHNLVTARRNGKAIHYRLSHPNIIRASDLVREMLIDQQQGNLEITNGLKLRMKDLVPLVTDPVCGMRISPRTAGAFLKINNEHYYFCASGCKEEFQKCLKNKSIKLSQK